MLFPSFPIVACWKPSRPAEQFVSRKAGQQEQFQIVQLDPMSIIQHVPTTIDEAQVVAVQVKEGSRVAQVGTQILGEIEASLRRRQGDVGAQASHLAEWVFLLA
jgi:hypothetical protein